MRRFILIADDEETNRSVLGEFFERCGYGIRLASDGFEALERAMEPRVDLAIFDYQMPGLSGLDALRRLRSSDCLTPVLIVTSQDREEVKSEALAIGAQGFLRKPIDLPVLRQHVVRLVGEERSLTIYRRTTAIIRYRRNE